MIENSSESNVDDNRMVSEPMDETACGRSGDGTKLIEVVTDTMNQKDNPMLIENSEESNVHDTANQKDNPIIIEDSNL